MTGGSPSGPPWWEFDPAEKPVPLDPNAEWEVGDDAELIVASERVAIEREETEPTLATLIARARRAKGDRTAESETRRRLAKRPAVLALAAGCVAMFVHGYSYGSAAQARGGQPRSRDMGSVTTDKQQPGSLGDSETTAPEARTRRR